MVKETFYVIFKSKNSGVFPYAPSRELCLGRLSWREKEEDSSFPPIRKRSIGRRLETKATPCAIFFFFFPFLFGTGRSLARKFSDGNGRIHISRRNIKGRPEREREGGETRLMAEGSDRLGRRKWWGLFSSVSDFSLSTSSWVGERRTVWKEDFNQVANQFGHRDSLVAKINIRQISFFDFSNGRAEERNGDWKV